MGELSKSVYMDEEEVKSGTCVFSSESGGQREEGVGLPVTAGCHITPADLGQLE